MRAILAAAFSLLILTPVAAGELEFVAARDLQPIKRLPAVEFGILERRAAPLVAWRQGGSGRDQEQAAATLQASAALSVDERKAVKVLMAELSKNDAVMSNTPALRAALSSAIFLDSPRLRERAPAIAELLAARDRLDEFFRQMPVSEVDELMTSWYGHVLSWDVVGLDAGQVSNLFVLQVWDACSLRNALAEEMPRVGRELDRYWESAKRIGAIEQTPEDKRVAAEHHAMLQRAAEDDHRQREAQEARRLAPKIAATAALDGLFTRDHGPSWSGPTRHSNPPIERGGMSPGLSALIEYAFGGDEGMFVSAKTKYTQPSIQFNDISPDAGACLASWYRHATDHALRDVTAGYANMWAGIRASAPRNKKLLKSIPADSTQGIQTYVSIYAPSLCAKLLGRFPSDSIFIVQTFPSDAAAIMPYDLVP